MKIIMKKMKGRRRRKREVNVNNEDRYRKNLRNKQMAREVKNGKKKIVKTNENLRRKMKRSGKSRSQNHGFALCLYVCRSVNCHFAAT
jgi:hypothetical protein